MIRMCADLAVPENENVEIALVLQTCFEVSAGGGGAGGETDPSRAAWGIRRRLAGVTKRFR